MFGNSSEVIETFMAQNYTVEMQSCYRDSFALMGAFEHGDIYEKLMDAFFDPEAEDPEFTSMRFHELMVEGILSVMSEHSISLQPEVTLDRANHILSSLLTIQKTEEYVPLLRILEANLDPVETFSRIVEAVTALDQAQVMECLDEENSNLPAALLGIKTFLIEKEAGALVQEEAPSEIASSLKDFFEACGKDNLAFQLTEAGILTGQPASVYYPYVDDTLVVDDNLQTAKNLLSFFLMASDTYLSPVESYRKYSESLLHSADRVSRVEEQFLNLMQTFNQYRSIQKRAKSVQNGTSAVGVSP